MHNIKKFSVHVAPNFRHVQNIGIVKLHLLEFVSSVRLHNLRTSLNKEKIKNSAHFPRANSSRLFAL